MYELLVNQPLRKFHHDPDRLESIVVTGLKVPYKAGRGFSARVRCTAAKAAYNVQYAEMLAFFLAELSTGILQYVPGVTSTEVGWSCCTTHALLD